MAALAVDQDQGVVGGQTAEVDRAYKRCRVADRLGADVERGNDGPEPVDQVVVALTHQLDRGNHVDRYRRPGDGAALGAGADDDDRLAELGRFFSLLVFVLSIRLLRQCRSEETE